METTKEEANEVWWLCHLCVCGWVVGMVLGWGILELKD